MLLRPRDALLWTHTIPMGLGPTATTGLFDGVIFGIQAVGRYDLPSPAVLVSLEKLAKEDLAMYRTGVSVYIHTIEEMKKKVQEMT